MKYKDFEPIGGMGQAGSDPAAQVEKIVSGFIGFLTVIAVIYFVFQIIFAGYAWITAAEDPQKLKQARDKIGQSLIGLVIVFFSMAIVGVIAYLLGGINVFNLAEFLNNLKIN